MTGQPTFYDIANPQALAANYPLGEAFRALATTISRDELRARQEVDFARVMARAWAMAFYRRLWGRAGVEPGDIRGLDDLAKLPTFGKPEIVESIGLAPPFGDFGGLDSYPPDQRPPVIFHTTSGTTGRPQPLLFGPKSREVQNLLLGRLYQLQGFTRDDVVHSVYGHGMINGGHYIREAVTRWTPATFMSAGTGVETRSVQQVALMRDFGATVIAGFADYVKKLAEVAESEGIKIGHDIRIRMITGQFGRDDKAAVSRLWGGATCLDWYGVGDTGVIAGEVPGDEGLMIFEDAHVVEIADIDTGALMPDGQPGDLIVTCLFKDDVYPIIRFNSHDVSMILPGDAASGLRFRRMAGFLGRSDNMVKLRGINVFPQAIGPVLAEDGAFAGEFVCKLVRDAAGREGLIVMAEAIDLSTATSLRLGALLRQRLGVEMPVELVAPGATAPLTQIDSRQKPIRLIDAR